MNNKEKVYNLLKKSEDKGVVLVSSPEGKKKLEQFFKEVKEKSKNN